MAAKPDALGALHDLLAEVMRGELEWYRAQEPPLPVPPALLQAVAKFLKDNCITSDPVDDTAVKALREEFQRQSAARRTAVQSLALAKEDIENMYSVQ